MLYLHGIFNKVWNMDANYASNYLPLISSYIKGERILDYKNTQKTEELIQFIVNDSKDSTYSSQHNTPDKAPANSIAIISITGAMTKYDQECGPAGMETKAEQLRRCYENDNIEGIILKVDSGGGESLSWRLMKDVIQQRNKQIVGFVYDCACSAAYGLVSSCDMVVANRDLAEVGSIGSLCTIVDYSEHFEKQGIKLIEVYATASTDKNRDFREALKGNTELLKQDIDVMTEDFINHVETSRSHKLTKDRHIWGTGRVFYAKEALEIGLIDKIDSLDNVINYFK